MQLQLGLNLQLQQSNAEILIVDHGQPPKNIVLAHKSVAIDSTAFDAYVGHYALPENRIMTVSRNNERIWTQLAGQPPVEVFPEGNGNFFANVVDVHFLSE